MAMMHVFSIQHFAPHEVEYFSQLFSLADTEHSGSIGGAAAVTFLTKSELPKAILKQIWEATTPNGEGFLDQTRFFVALKLIAQSQAGLPINLEALHSRPLELPKFKGIPLPQPPSQKSAEPPANPQVEQQIQMFRTGFKQLAGPEGILTGEQGTELLQRMQVSPEQAKKIFGLIDPYNTKKMNEDQFIAAAQIIGLMQATHSDVPAELPEPLKVFVIKNEAPAKPIAKPPEPQSPVQIEPPPKQEEFLEKPQRIQHVPSDFSNWERPSDSVVSNPSSSKGSLKSPVPHVQQSFVDKNQLLNKLRAMMEHDRLELQLFKDKNSLLERFINEQESKSADHLRKIKGKKKPGSDFKEQIKKLEHQIASLQSNLQTQQAQNSKLATENQTLQKSIADLQAKHQKEIAELKARPRTQPAQASLAQPASAKFAPNPFDSPLSKPQPAPQTVPKQEVPPPKREVVPEPIKKEVPQAMPKLEESKPKHVKPEKPDSTGPSQKPISASIQFQNKTEFDPNDPFAALVAENPPLAIQPKHDSPKHQVNIEVQPKDEPEPKKEITGHKKKDSDDLFSSSSEEKKEPVKKEEFQFDFKTDHIPFNANFDSFNFGNAAPAAPFNNEVFGFNQQVQQKKSSEFDWS